jgi:serine phosphatase RsbU (regulator of sigma subunit)
MSRSYGILAVLTICIFIVLSCLPAPSHATGAVIVDYSMASVSIGSNLEYLEDSAGNLSFDDIVSGKNIEAGRWTRSSEDSLGFGFSTSVYWVRFSVKNPTDRDIVLYLKQEYPLINLIYLYTPGENGKYTVFKTGSYYPFSERPIKYRNFVFPLTLKAGTTATCYLRYQSNSSMNIQLSVQSPESFRKTKDTELMFLWIYYGIFLAMFIYNLIMFIASRDWNYFFYIMYIASFGIFTMSINGTSYQYLWPDNAWLGNFSSPISMAIIIISLILFVIRFMDVKSHSIILDRLNKTMVALAIALLAMTLLLRDYRLSINSLTILSGVASCIGMITVVYMIFRAKSRPAILFSISLILFLPGVIMMVLRLEGLLPTTLLTKNGILAGAGLQVIMLSFGLLDRINIMRNGLRVLNANLENKVMDRTNEMAAANEEIDTMNQNLIEVKETLWGEMELAKKIQTILLPENPSVMGYDIIMYMKPAVDVGGDYYDVISAGGMDWIVIGDVSGHGVPAGIIMMMVQTSINTIIMDQPELSPSEVLTKVNRTIYRNIRKLGEDKYMTIAVLAAHRDGRFVFSGLHQDILVYRKNSREVDIIDTNGMWIGVIDELEGRLSDNTLNIGAGDTLLLYTDGITEAWEKGSSHDKGDPDTQMFGAERLRDKFKEVADRPLDEIKNRIIDSLGNYDCSDDVTLVIIRRK